MADDTGSSMQSLPRASSTGEGRVGVKPAITVVFTSYKINHTKGANLENSRPVFIEKELRAV